MKRLWLVIILGLIFAGLALASAIWYTSQLAPVNPRTSITHEVIVEPGQSASVTFADLAAKQLIRSELAAKIYARLNRLDQTILPGTYSVSPSQSVADIIQVISEGPKDVRVTLTEGWRREQIAAHLESALPSGNFSSSEFLAQTTSLEGQLFPDTYLFPPTATTTEVISLITDNFLDKVGGFDRQTLILASLIEREANVAADRPVVAGILKNRLDADWPLQVDATVQYGRDTADCSSQPSTCDWWSPLLDTQFPTIYNTYLNPGLPPGPICNPGLASIEAARHPSDTPYWYYLTGNDGITYFARDLDEHNRNVDKHLLP